jgi:hypothetical protein
MFLIADKLAVAKKVAHQEAQINKSLMKPSTPQQM